MYPIQGPAIYSPRALNFPQETAMSNGALEIWPPPLFLLDTSTYSEHFTKIKSIKKKTAWVYTFSSTRMLPFRRHTRSLYHTRREVLNTVFADGRKPCMLFTAIAVVALLAGLAVVGFAAWSAIAIVRQ